MIPVTLKLNSYTWKYIFPLIIYSMKFIVLAKVSLSSKLEGYRLVFEEWFAGPNGCRKDIKEIQFRIVLDRTNNIYGCKWMAKAREAKILRKALWMVKPCMKIKLKLTRFCYQKREGGTGSTARTVHDLLNIKKVSFSIFFRTERLCNPVQDWLRNLWVLSRFST